MECAYNNIIYPLRCLLNEYFKEWENGNLLVYYYEEKGISNVTPCLC